jgi:hypothetical protein
MYIPVSTSSIIFSNIPKKIKEYKEYNNQFAKINDNTNNDIYLATLFLIISISAFLALILYKIHFTKKKQF